MLIRFIAKNIFSFNEETEFNLFPNKTQRLPHHKIRQNDFDILRMSAIYGANGSGKSNLIKAIASLASMIKEGKLSTDLDDQKFKLNDSNKDLPTSLGIEFYTSAKVFYYTLTFDKNIILNESLYESKKESDRLVFERNVENNIQTIIFFDGYTNNPKNQLFVEVLAEKILQKNELLLNFLHSKYKEDFTDVSTAFEWFNNTLVLIKPETKPRSLTYLLDTYTKKNEFANQLMVHLNTGIAKIDIDKRKAEEYTLPDSKEMKDIIERLKKEPDQMFITKNPETNEEAILVYENEELFVKKLVTKHLNNKGAEVDFSINMESDGTKRLIEYIPAFYDVINNDRVYLIDEIERSLHPITIKEIITKISLDQSTKGQLIFTTHESCLLDQEILRPDEIWFAQKDIDEASQLYSLSDFNIHHTANIENGYLNGRYGGIPFLANLKDLNWHKNEESVS